MPVHRPHWSSARTHPRGGRSPTARAPPRAVRVLHALRPLTLTARALARACARDGRRASHGRNCCSTEAARRSPDRHASKPATARSAWARRLLGGRALNPVGGAPLNGPRRFSNSPGAPGAHRGSPPAGRRREPSPRWLTGPPPRLAPSAGDLPQPKLAMPLATRKRRDGHLWCARVRAMARWRPPGSGRTNMSPRRACLRDLNPCDQRGCIWARVGGKDEAHLRSERAESTSARKRPRIASVSASMRRRKKMEKKFDGGQFEPRTTSAEIWNLRLASPKARGGLLAALGLHIRDIIHATVGSHLPAKSSL